MRKEHRANLARDLASDEIRFIKDEDEFEFRCQLCGNCCLNQSILLSSYEVYSITRNPHVREMFGIRSTTDFFDRGYGGIFLGSDSKVPLCVINNNEFSNKIEVCPFVVPIDKAPETFVDSWKSKRQISETPSKDPEISHVLCGLDEAGPLVCKSYPFGRISRRSPEDIAKGKPLEMKAVFLPITCAGAGKGHIQAEAYLKALNVYEGWQATDAHFKFVNWLASEVVTLPQIKIEHLLKIGYLMYNFDALPHLVDKEGQPFDTDGAPFEKIFESITLTIKTLVKLIQKGDFLE